MSTPTILIPLPFRVDIAHEPSVVTVEGEVDALTAPLVIRAARAAGEPTTDLTVDLSAVSFIDTAGASALSTLLSDQRDAGRQMVVSGASVRMDRMLRLMGLGDLLNG
jgi:anti-sigma B factor antagonist